MSVKKLSSIIIALLLLSLSLVSCAEKAPNFSIKTVHPLSGEEIVIPNVANKNPSPEELYSTGVMRFQSKLNADEIADAAEKLEGVNVSVNERGIIIERAGKAKNTTDIFFIENQGSFYVLSSMRSRIITGSSENYSVILPLHLLKETPKNSSSVAYTVNADTEYELLDKISGNDIYSFYQKLGYYSVSLDGSTVTLSGYTTELSEAQLKPDTGYGTLDVKFPVKITISEKDGKSFMKISLE